MRGMNLVDASQSYGPEYARPDREEGDREGRFGSALAAYEWCNGVPDLVWGAEPAKRRLFDIAAHYHNRITVIS